MSFGWSVGDVLAVTEIIFDIARALRESGGSAERYNSNEQWLRSLGTVLLRVQAEEQDRNGTGTNNAAASQISEEGAEIARRVYDLQKELTGKFDISLGRGRSRHWYHRIDKKLEFHLFAEKKIAALKEDVDGPLRTIILHVGLDTRAESQETRAVSQDTNNMVRQLLQKLGRDDQEKRERERLLVLKWLNPVLQTETKFKKRCKSNVQGSGEWLLKNETYNQWLMDSEETDSKNLLWVTGIPGGGKTGLATSVIQRLRSARDRNFAVGFFYCDGQSDPATQSTQAILRTWLWQLVSSYGTGKVWDRDSIDQMWMVLIGAWKVEPEPSEETLQKALTTLLEDDGFRLDDEEEDGEYYEGLGEKWHNKMPTKTPQTKTVLVLDGLDESQDDTYTTIVRDVLPALLPYARCMVLCRLSKDIERVLSRAMRKQPYRQIHIETDDVAEDMRRFWEREIDAIMDNGDDESEDDSDESEDDSEDENDRQKDADTKLRSDLMEVFAQRANGMFQWTAAVTKTLQRATRGDFLELVRQAPQELDELYGKILSDLWEGMARPTRNKSKRILQMLACSMRPLTLREIDGVLQVKLIDGDGSAKVEKDTAYPLTRRELLILCGALVDIDDSVTTTASSPSVRLAHLSTKEFLLNKKNSNPLLDGLVVEETSAHATAARICLAYLTCDAFGMVPYRPAGGCKEHGALPSGAPPGPYEREVDKYLDGRPLQRYAAIYWARHVLASCHGGVPDADTGVTEKVAPTANVEAAILRLCRSDKSTIRWLMICKREIGDRSNFRGSQVWNDDQAVFAPLGELLSHEAREIYSAWLSHITGNTALHNFSRWERFTSSTSSGNFPSDVHTAVYFDFVEYVKAYLEKDGADPNLMTYTRQRPLHFAANAESVESAKLLLARGADPNALGWSFHRPLSFTVYSANDDNQRGRHTGPYEVATLLLEAGADPFQPSYEPPIYRAMLAATAHIQDPDLIALVRKMLSSQGRPVKENMQQLLKVSLECHVSPLHYIVSRDIVDMLDMFLGLGEDAGLDINYRDQAGRTLLDAATYEILAGRCIMRLLQHGGKTAAELRAAEEKAEREKAASGDNLYWPQSSSDIFDAYLALQRKFDAAVISRDKNAKSETSSRALILRILDLAGYWLESISERTDHETFTSQRCERGDVVYLTTPPLLGRRYRPVCEIQFTICAHDQGWTDDVAHRGTFDFSWTWFDFDIVGQDKSKRTGRPVELVHNLHGIPQTSCYRNRMARNHVEVTTGPQTVWMRDVCAGDHIVVYARALYPGWANHVKSIRVKIYTTCLLE